MTTNESLNKESAEFSPLPKAREFAFAAAVYLAAAMLFLWPVVTPGTIATALQELDSGVTAAIVSHTARALMGRDSFWNLEIFYPYEETLCLSDPMITEAILAAPVRALAGPVAAHNVYLYFTSWSIAFATWLFLRHRQLAPIPAILGGILTGFAITRLLFLAGQSHLLFQAGFAISLLAAERSTMRGTSRLWPVLFVAAFFFQVFTGFFLLVLFALWCLLIPGSLWRGASGSLLQLKARRGRLLAMSLGIAATGLAFLPLAIKYRTFAQSTTEIPMSVTAHGASNWRSYVYPPHSLISTKPGVWLQDAKKVDSDILESVTFLGWTTIFLCGLAAAGVLWRFCGPGRWRWLRIEGPFAASLVALTLAAGILSAGPYLGKADADHPHGAGLLPFGFLFEHAPAIRFFRTTARFSIPVIWTTAISAAYGLNWLLARFHERWFRVCVGAFFVLLAGFEHFPVRAFGRIPAQPLDSTRRLMEETDPRPFVSYPKPDIAKLLAQVSWHGVPIVNGYSGYNPASMVSEIQWFEKNFPAPESFLLFERWGIDRVLLSNNATEEAKAAAEASPVLEEEWRAEDATMWNLPYLPETYESWLSRIRGLRVRSAASITLEKDFATSSAVRALEPTVAKSAGADGRTQYRNPSGITTLVVRFSEPVDPVWFTHLQLRGRIRGALSLRENITVQWVTRDNPDPDPIRRATTTFLCDGEMHPASIALGEHIAWITGDPVTELRIAMGDSDGNVGAIEHMTLEDAPIRWRLPPRGDAAGLPAFVEKNSE